MHVAPVYGAANQPQERLAAQCVEGTRQRRRVLPSPASRLLLADHRRHSALLHHFHPLLVALQQHLLREGAVLRRAVERELVDGGRLKGGGGESEGRRRVRGKIEVSKGN